MSWEQVFNLIKSCGGKIERAEPCELSAATAEGHGSPAVQIQIAQIEYERQYKGKEVNDGQEKWSFG